MKAKEKLLLTLQDLGIDDTDRQCALRNRLHSPYLLPYTSRLLQHIDEFLRDAAKEGAKEVPGHTTFQEVIDKWESSTVDEFVDWLKSGNAARLPSSVL